MAERDRIKESLALLQRMSKLIMDKNILKSDALLLLTAAIWGFAFVAQRVGMDYIGPFWYSGIRFAMGALFLIPIYLMKNKKSKKTGIFTRGNLGVSLLAGTILFIAANFQQVGIKFTTAGKAGFITGLYVVLVPLAGLFFRRRTRINAWMGAVLAALGLYFLSLTGGFVMERGDFLVFLGAFFWTAHILVIDRFSPNMDSLVFSIGQYLVCSILSSIIALIVENLTWSMISSALPALIYGGVFSIGIAYTLQVVAQKTIQPAHASIILSLESVFALLGGIILLSEPLTLRTLLGSALMLAGMIISQVNIEAKT